MIQSIAEQIGLTLKEYDTYKTLLAMGEVPIYDIVNKTGDHPQVIYRALEGLSSKGLVQTTIKKRKKYVSAEDPSMLEKMAERNVIEVRNAIPELLALKNEFQGGTLITAYSGIESVRDMRARMVDELPEGGTLYIIGASGNRFYEIMGKRLKSIEEKRVQKKIVRKLISYESQREAFSGRAKEKLTEIRYLPENFSAPASTNIYGNKVSLFIFSEDPSIVVIDNKEAAESYLNYFHTLWRIAKP